MKAWILVIAVGITSLWAGSPLFAQEEASADLFLEAYTDQFQEVFFEALREKGIENYDRARALLLQCKELEPQNPVIDHELARVLLLEKELPAAEAYAVTAVLSRPGEYWYWNTLMEVLSAQYKTPESVTGLPLNADSSRLHLARWHVGSGQGEQALKYLDRLPDTRQALALRQQAGQLISKSETQGSVSAPGEQAPASGAPSVEDYLMRLAQLESDADWEGLRVLATEAAEWFPLQPQVFYFKGIALVGQQQLSEALVELETGESLLLEEGPWANRMYSALQHVHQQLGNAEKAKWYADKVKTGL